MNLSRPILKPDGEECTVSYPSQKIINSSKNEKGEFEMDKLPKETVRNVILQCLNFASSKNGDVYDGAMIMYISQEIIKGKKDLVLRPKFRDFLIEILEDQIIVEEVKKGKNGNDELVVRGKYKSWCIFQVLEELGVKTKEL